MKRSGLFIAGSAWLLAAGTLYAFMTQEKEWPVHDTSRPLPEVVTPGERPGDPPSDADVLFNGSDLSLWEAVTPAGSPAAWKVQESVLTVGPPSSGSIRTKESFGDCQLHIEWRTVEGSHGNSGVFLQSLYEIQVFESYKNKEMIYADGVAASLYGQQVPLVNACRPTGRWQVFEIVFRAPRFDEKGKLLHPGRVTLFHNGVLVLDNAEIKGYTVHGKPAEYLAHPPKQPLLLQNHGDPVDFRNIWIRPLVEPGD